MRVIGGDRVIRVLPTVMLQGRSFEREGFVFGGSKLETFCLQRNLILIPQEEASDSDGGDDDDFMDDPSMDSNLSSELPTNNVYNARLEDILRGFAKDPKALAHKIRDFTVRTLVGMNDDEFQSMFELLRSEISVADFFAIKVGVREAKKRFNAGT